jgi:hypothetical protein
LFLVLKERSRLLKLSDGDQIWYGENKQKTDIYFLTFLLLLIHMIELAILLQGNSN